jgi:glyoxylase-like metal-dependent hydrolase (beta-lactamase superfamily II)
VISHFHGDHVNGIGGLAGADGTPAIHVTRSTSSLVNERNRPADETRARLLQGAVDIDPTRPTAVDLGGRRVTIHPTAGHTPSDVWVMLDDPPIVFCGDLVWNGMFPNYANATPSNLARAVPSLRRDGNPTYVPGHGPVARSADFDRYVALLGEVESAARGAHRRGLSADDAASSYQLPASLGEWILFSDRFLGAAFAAWYRELNAAG